MAVLVDEFIRLVTQSHIRDNKKVSPRTLFMRSSSNKHSLRCVEKQHEEDRVEKMDNSFEVGLKG